MKVLLEGSLIFRLSKAPLKNLKFIRRGTKTIFIIGHTKDFMQISQEFF